VAKFFQDHHANPNYFVLPQSKVSWRDISVFQKAVLSMQTDFPFSEGYGVASSRRECLDSATKLHDRLLRKQQNDETLDIQTIALSVACDRSGNSDERKIRRILEVFQPDKDGKLSSEQFLGSIDAIYRGHTILLRSAANAVFIYRTYEHILNVGFSVCVAVGVFSILGINPFFLVLSLASLIASLALLIGPVVSSYFEGFNLVLLRQPYDIGDVICTSSLLDRMSLADGASGAVVEDFDLFTTTLRLSQTNEVFVLPNTALSRLKIINMTCSGKALVHMKVKLAMGTSATQIQILKRVVDNFVKKRRREWVCVRDFSPSSIDDDLRYVFYSIILQHRESWQNARAVLESKVNFGCFCSEVQNQLGMRYVVPSENSALGRHRPMSRSLKEQIDALEQSGDSKTAT